MLSRPVLISMMGIVAVIATAQTPPAPFPTDPQAATALKPRPDAPPDNGAYHINAGTHILLNMINSVSTKQATVGDALYLETAFPVLVNGKIVVPQGSWVKGTVTSVTRPGRVKGKGQLQVRFDSLTLPNGVTRDFRANPDAVDARENESMNKENGSITGPGNKKGDGTTIAETAAAGTGLGTIIGAEKGAALKGAGIGAGAGAAAGLVGVLLTRGPDATLTKGSTVEMILDRPVTFSEQDVNFNGAPPRAALSEGGPAPVKRSGVFGRANPL